ncbi:MAG TPA: hypothetical protein VM452_01550 [Caulifigura sp.]|nr:hypothetical protein [Caulifigura sp.]
MFRRIVAGVLLGAILFAAASIVSHGLKHPGFLQPDDRPESIIASGPTVRH